MALTPGARLISKVTEAPAGHVPEPPLVPELAPPLATDPESATPLIAEPDEKVPLPADPDVALPLVEPLPPVEPTPELPLLTPAESPLLAPEATPPPLDPDVAAEPLAAPEPPSASGARVRPLEEHALAAAQTKKAPNR